MGVTGLWSLVEPAGKPVPLESLENKILAVGKVLDLKRQIVNEIRHKMLNNCISGLHYVRRLKLKLNLA